MRDGPFTGDYTGLSDVTLIGAVEAMPTICSIYVKGFNQPFYRPFGQHLISVDTPICKLILSYI
jgi:hypothetical protein